MPQGGVLPPLLFLICTYELATATSRFGVVYTAVPYTLQSTSLMPAREVGDLGFLINTKQGFSGYYGTLVRKANYSIYTVFTLLGSKDPQVYLVGL